MNICSSIVINIKRKSTQGSTKGSAAESSSKGSWSASKSTKASESRSERGPAKAKGCNGRPAKAKPAKAGTAEAGTAKSGTAEPIVEAVVGVSGRQGEEAGESQKCLKSIF